MASEFDFLPTVAEPSDTRSGQAVASDVERVLPETPREGWSSARAKAVGSRYAAAVEVRAVTPEAARALLARMGLELVGGIQLLPRPAVEFDHPNNRRYRSRPRHIRSRLTMKPATFANGTRPRNHGFQNSTREAEPARCDSSCG